MFCVFPQGWITSSWCDGPVSTSTGQNRQRDCTHHAKLRMTQFLLQPEISHYYFLSWIKSMTCERQRPCRVYWNLYTIWPWLFDHAKGIMILRVEGSFNYLFANTGELWPPYMFRDHTWMFEQVLVCRYTRNSAWKDHVHVEERAVLIGPGWWLTCSSSVLQLRNLKRNTTINKLCNMSFEAWMPISSSLKICNHN